MRTSFPGDRLLLESQIFTINILLLQIFIFKHADRDHEETLNFNPNLSDFFALEACGTYHKLTGEFPPLFKLFQIWYIATHQNMFNFPDDRARTIESARIDVLSLEREGYFNTLLPILMRFGT
ncbi:MAG: hypothetical protein ACOZF2_13295 [Thermodesulfobacteriota bacterium]